ncbi:uncharacterized protein LOC104666765 [Rhinopithecus roxellana]|uniref:uncharacterized protein LOC104666765 n=1 Tax=Rhinopithecus roxellana TaxID=61622 RepID=UPI0012379B86|nr:uncharacterized protein LOC104666765 [Rhinopithecus roxellana]
MAASAGFGDPLDFSPPPEPCMRKQIASATASNQKTPRRSASQKRNRDAPSKAVTRPVHAPPVSLRVTLSWPRGSSVCLSPRSPRYQRQLVTRPATPSKGRESAELRTLTMGRGRRKAVRTQPGARGAACQGQTEEDHGKQAGRAGKDVMRTGHGPIRAMGMMSAKELMACLCQETSTSS